MQKNYLLALSSALILWLAWPPIPYTSPLLFVGFVPLLLAIHNIIHSAEIKKGNKIFKVSFLVFFIWNTASIYWVFNSLNAVMPFMAALLISLVPFGLAALLMSAAFWLFYQLLVIKGKTWGYIGLISFWIGYEYLHQSWDLAFPWMNLGNGFATFTQLIQWYEYTGVYGGTLWILLANILIFECYQAFRKADRKIKMRLLIVLSAWLSVPAGVSLYIYTTYHEQLNPSNVVIVQPNIDPYDKFGTSTAASQLQTLLELSDSKGQTNTEYFIWPETALSQYVDESTIRSSAAYFQIQGFLQKYKNANVLSGIESYAIYDSAKTPTARYQEHINKYTDAFNTAVQIENSAQVQFYHKSKLVPGVEQLPFSAALSFMKPLFSKFGGTTGGYGYQAEPSVFYSQSGIGVSPVICYESIWGVYVAESVRKGSQFIAIITNDGWWGNTSGKDQHFDYARLRAIETRRWVARSANTGISGFINQRGDIIQRSQWWVPAALKADINLNDKLTFYTIHGDLIAKTGSYLCVLFLLLIFYKRFIKSESKKLHSIS